MSPSSTSNPVASITNNLGAAVDIYDVFNPNTDPKTPGPLTYTKLATVANGSTQQVQTIHFASQLQAMLTGNIEKLNGNFYEQLPVAVLAVSPFADSNAFTITSDMQQSMVDSFKFIKYSGANPSLQLATQFRAALGDKTSQKDAVNKFFQSTGSFKLCTLTTWTAVFSWQGQFTSAWQGTYYLYSVGSSNAGSNSSAPALVATLAITASATASSAVLTMADTNNENTTVVMGGDGSMQEENQGTGNLAVSLKPTWLNVTQTSKQGGKTVSNYVIGAAFKGTINGVNVAGDLNQLNTTDSKKKSANEFSLNTLEGLIGMLTSIGMLYYMAKDHKQSETQKKNNEEEKASNKKEAKDNIDKIEKEYQQNEVPEVQIKADSVDSIVSQVQQGYKEVGQAEVIQIRQDVIQKQEKNLEEILEGGAPSQATEDTAMSLEQASKKLEDAAKPDMDPGQRDGELTDVTKILSNASANIEQTLQDQGNQLSDEEADVLKNAQDSLEKVQEQTESQEENQKEQEQKDNEDVDNEVDDGTFEDAKPKFEGEF
ncbi:hypothetical protein TWF694_001441 [Orbilia ellipsospora]|uniref:Uncharacterized protein n=1 Tax=Orbilia ellipsospora TaxID=2528407 RepID=A0AAV9XY62_9PEZI